MAKLKDFPHFLALLGVKIRLNLRAEAGKHQLSYAWWLLEPLLEAAVFFIVFGVFLASGTENFVAFLLTGLIPYTWFTRSVSNAMGSIRGAKWLLDSFRIHPAFFPLVELGQDAVKQTVTFSFLLLFIFFYGIEPSLTWLLLPFAMLLQLLLVASVACFTASVIPLLEDLKYLISTVLLLGMFASGIFYDPQVMLTDEWRQIYYANPMASMLQIYRDLLMNGYLPTLYNAVVVLVWSVIFAGLASASLQHFRRHYARLILE